MSHKRCRRCGGEPILDQDEDRGSRVVCWDCGLPTPWGKGDQAAWMDWENGVVDYSRAKCFTTSAEDAGIYALEI